MNKLADYETRNDMQDRVLNYHVVNPTDESKKQTYENIVKIVNETQVKYTQNFDFLEKI